MNPDPGEVHFSLRVWGDYALFNQPQFSADPHSYPCITPSAAKGLLKNIAWKPEFEWEVARIHILNPIRYEVQKIKIIGNRREDIRTADPSLQVMTLLRDVAYQIDARIVVNPYRVPESTLRSKYLPMIQRYLEMGREWKRPALGRTEYTAEWELVERESKPETIDFDERFSMTFDMAPVDITSCDSPGSDGDIWDPIFFEAHFVQGVLDVPEALYAEHRDRLMQARMTVHGPPRQAPGLKHWIPPKNVRNGRAAHSSRS